MWPPPSAPPATAGDLGPLEILVVESYTNHTLFVAEQEHQVKVSPKRYRKGIDTIWQEG
jgi:AraC-like DNA-binding protein